MKQPMIGNQVGKRLDQDLPRFLVEMRRCQKLDRMSQPHIEC